MINQQDVEQAVKRMQSVWPRVQTTPGLKAEMVAAVMRHAGKLEPADLSAGVDSLIESRPAAQDTGWAAAPPGPHEVVGCLLTARVARMQNAPAVRTSLAQGTRDKMRQGNVCAGAGGGFDFLPTSCEGIGDESNSNANAPVRHGDRADPAIGRFVYR